MSLPTFASIHRRALDFWGEAHLRSRLLQPLSAQELTAHSDDFYLSAMSRRVFRAGLKHSLVDSKWPEFEKAFWQFKAQSLVLISEEQLEAHMKNKKIIRHWGKIKTIPKNAQLVLDIAAEHGSVGRFIAAWPEEDMYLLWEYLKARGSHLGGNSAASFLRMVGKDTYIYSKDVVGALRAMAIVEKVPTSKRDKLIVQEAFNQWRAESGLPLCQISMILALSFSKPDE